MFFELDRALYLLFQRLWILIVLTFLRELTIRLRTSGGPRHHTHRPYRLFDSPLGLAD